MTTKIHVDESFLKGTEGTPRIPLIEAHLSNLSHEEKTVQFGSLYSDFQLVDELSDSDLEVVPFDLKTCVELSLFNQVLKRESVVGKMDKFLALFAVNDESLAKHYHRDHLMTFANLGYQSDRQRHEFCWPWFIDDPLPVYQKGELKLRKKQDKPVLGFCGRAVITPSRLGWQVLRNASRTLKSWMRLDPFAPPHIVSEVAFRSRILKSLETSRVVDTDFVLRTKFLAGISRIPEVRDERQHPVRLAFIDNIVNTDYTVCLRGAANWSMRLYETLSLGRIPVYVDTDSILPFDFKIDWKDYVVWVDAKDISRIDQVVADFHASISNDEFMARQVACRKLWEQRLSREGFFAHFHEHLENDKSVKEKDVGRAPVEVSC